VLAIASIAASMTVVATSQVLTPDAFTEFVARALRARLIATQVTVSDPLELQATREPGITRTLRVGNLYDAYRSRPGDLERIVSGYVEAISKTPTMRLASSTEAVLPVVRTRAWLDDLRASEDSKLTPAIDRPTELVEPYGEGLVVAYVLDDTRSTSALTPRTLQGIGIERRSLYATATANLGRQNEKVHVQPGPIVTLVTAGGRFDTALLLLDALWHDNRISVDGDPVALAGDYGLFVTGSRNQAGIARLKETMALAKSRSERAAQALLIYRNGRFVAYPTK
jgi:hypothetical protein